MQRQPAVSAQPKLRRPSAVSQVLRAITASVDRPTFRFSKPSQEPALVPPPAPEAREPFTLAVASDRATRESAYRLAWRVYRNKGYVGEEGSGLVLSPYDAHPSTFTLLVRNEKGDDVATVTLVFDSDAGLPCDEIYRDELTTLRAQGRRMAEVTRLAIADEYGNSKQLIPLIFNAIYVYACLNRGYTDFVIEVNPRHVGFYRRFLLFEAAGPVRPCMRVGGAPAVLLRLNFEIAVDSFFRPKASGSSAQNAFAIPMTREEELQLAQRLCAQHKPISEDEKRIFGLDQLQTHLFGVSAAS